MTYGEMKARYEDIDGAFERVADDVHDGYTSAEAVKRIRPWVNRKILPADRGGVLAKLDQCARAVEDANAGRRSEQMKL